MTAAGLVGTLHLLHLLRIVASMLDNEIPLQQYIVSDHIGSFCAIITEKGKQVNLFFKNLRNFAEIKPLICSVAQKISARDIPGGQNGVSNKCPLSFQGGRSPTWESLLPKPFISTCFSVKKHHYKEIDCHVAALLAMTVF